MYVAGSQNPNFLGSAPLEQMAKQIASSHGPSGSNADYVTQLADTLRARGVKDAHVFSIEAAVDKFMRGEHGQTT